MSTATASVSYADQAVQWIAKNEYFAFLGEEKIRLIVAACDRIEASFGVDVFNEGRWINPALRKEILKVLADDLPQISETYAWMVARRYRELRRFFKEKDVLAEKKRLEDEAKAKLAAEKAAKAAAAKAAKPAEPAAAKPAESAPAKPEPAKE